MKNIQEVRILSIEPLITPSEMERELPLSDEAAERITEYRHTVNSIIRGEDSRLLAVIGPCSIHDTEAALDYARKLRELADSVSDVFFMIWMRAAI